LSRGIASFLLPRGAEPFVPLLRAASAVPRRSRVPRVVGVGVRQGRSGRRGCASEGKVASGKGRKEAGWGFLVGIESLEGTTVECRHGAIRP
jgi:hypothetical protein